MLNSLTQRERFLAILVGSMLPVLLVFAFGYWFYSSYQHKRTMINAKTRQIETEKTLQTAIRNANYQRDWYRDISLPSNLSVAKSDYKDWLSKLADSKLKHVKPVSVSPEGNAVPVKFKNVKNVFHQLKFQLNAYTTLEKYTEFLYEFHQFNLLHRVSSFTIKPVERKKPGGGMELTGEIHVTMKIEVVALVDAAEDRDVFASLTHELPRTLEEYQDVIVHRDIFGAANHRPDITTTATQRFEEGDHVGFQIIAEDLDEDDELTFELIHPSGSKLKDLIEMNPRGRKAIITTKDLGIGAHRFKMKVTDNGCPAKHYEKEFTIRVSEKPAPPQQIVRTPKPKFQHAKAAHITAIVRNAKGDAEVWVNVRTLKEFYELTVGKSFRMDGFEWQVKEIDVDNNKVVISRDDEEFVYQKADFLFRKLPVATSDKSKREEPKKEDAVKRE